MLIITLIITGIGIGYLLRKKEFLLKYIDPILIILMFALLTILGLNLGIDKKVINSFKDVGFYAVIIAISSILGSSFIGFLLYRVFFREE